MSGRNRKRAWFSGLALFLVAVPALAQETSKVDTFWILDAKEPPLLFDGVAPIAIPSLLEKARVDTPSDPVVREALWPVAGKTLKLRFRTLAETTGFPRWVGVHRAARVGGKARVMTSQEKATVYVTVSSRESLVRMAPALVKAGGFSLEAPRAAPSKLWHALCGTEIVSSAWGDDEALVQDLLRATGCEWAYAGSVAAIVAPTAVRKVLSPQLFIAGIEGLLSLPAKLLAQSPRVAEIVESSATVAFLEKPMGLLRLNSDLRVPDAPTEADLRELSNDILSRAPSRALHAFVEEAGGKRKLIRIPSTGKLGEPRLADADDLLLNLRLNGFDAAQVLNAKNPTDILSTLHTVSDVDVVVLVSREHDYWKVMSRGGNGIVATRTVRVTQRDMSNSALLRLADGGASVPMVGVVRQKGRAVAVASPEKTYARGAWALAQVPWKNEAALLECRQPSSAGCVFVVVAANGENWPELPVGTAIEALP